MRCENACNVATVLKAVEKWHNEVEDSTKGREVHKVSRGAETQEKSQTYISDKSVPKSTSIVVE